jgi:hypothetical protein
VIRGHVSADKEAVIPLQLRGAQGQVETIQAVVDTGFTGALALPSALVARLGMPFRRGRYSSPPGGTVPSRSGGPRDASDVGARAHLAGGDWTRPEQ